MNNNRQPIRYPSLEKLDDGDGGRLLKDFYKQHQIIFVSAEVDDFCEGYDWELTITTEFDIFIAGGVVPTRVSASWDFSGCSCNSPPQRLDPSEATLNEGIHYDKIEKKFYSRGGATNPKAVRPDPTKDRNLLKKFKDLMKR